VDSNRFLRELPGLFEDFPRSEHPLDRRLQPVLEEVENLASENVLALLNLAVSCLAPEETYVEVGVLHGASLIAATIGNEEKRIVGIDNFTLGKGSAARVEENFTRFGLPKPELLEGDVFELVPNGALDGRKVGVWYYDASHAYEAQIEGLRIAEPYLVPGALIIVDDTDWEQVERAMDDYLAEQPRTGRILELDGKDRGSPQWWEGMQVLRWEGQSPA
jgi:predicted O-methyltransferase YrrM